MAIMAALLTVSAYGGAETVEQRKESIVRVSLEKQGHATVDPALLESARRAAAIVSLKLPDPASGPGLEIRTDGHPAYDWFFLKEEKKLVIDFHNTINFESGKVLTPEGESPILRVRTSLFALEPEFVSRVVLDMKSMAVPTFYDVEKGVDLRLIASETPAATDGPDMTLAVQLLSELEQQRQSLQVTVSRLAQSMEAAEADRPAVELGATPEQDTPSQNALRTLITQEGTFGTEFRAYVEAAASEVTERIGTLEARVHELETSIDRGTVAEPAATSALQALATEISEAGRECSAQFAQFEKDLATTHRQFEEEFTQLADVDPGRAAQGKDLMAPAMAALPSPTPEQVVSMSPETVATVLEGLSHRLAALVDMPEAAQSPTTGDVVTGAELSLAGGPFEAGTLNNQLAQLQNPIAALFEEDVEHAEIDTNGLQLVTLVPLNLVASRLHVAEDAAAANQPAKEESDEDSPEKAPEAATEDAAANASETPAVVEKSAEPVTEQQAPTKSNAAPAAESAETAPAAQPDQAPTTTEKLAPPTAVPGSMIEDVPRGGLPAGMDPLDQPVNIDFREMDLSAVVSLLAKKAQVNVIAGTDVIGTVTADIRNVPLRQAMDMVLRMNGLGIVEEEGIFRIVPYEEAVAARRETRMVVLKHAQAEDVKTTLDGVLVGAVDASLMSISSNPATNTLILAGPEERVQEFEMLSHQLDVSEPTLPTVTEAIKLNYLEPADAKPIAMSLITEDVGQVESDEQGRHLVVTDMPVVVEQIRTVLNDVDKPVKQVAVDTMIVDAVMRDGSQTGVSWLLDAIRRYSSNGDLVSDVSEAQFRTNLGVPFGAGGLPDAALLPGVLDAGAITLGILTSDIRLNTVIAAETQSRNAEILANPSVVTVENQPALITIVQEFPYQEITQGLTGPPVATTEFKDIGVRLEVTPRVTHENDTIINIKAKQSSVSGLTETGVPIEDKREAETTLRAENGRTIFIGGLRNVSDSHSVSKIPVLGDIPLLNVMFKNSNIEKINTELLIFLTCRVLEDPLPRLTPSQQRENDKLDATPQVPDSQRPLFRDYVKPQEMRDPMWKWRRSNY